MVRKNEDMEMEMEMEEVEGEQGHKGKFAEAVERGNENSGELKKDSEEAPELLMGEIPEYMKLEEETLIIEVEDFEGRRELRIGVDEVAKYYAEEAPNITSGCRTLAGYTGDWRNIDQLAGACLATFIHVCPEKMKEAGKRVGLKARF